MKLSEIKSIVSFIIASLFILAGCNSPTEVNYNGQYFPLSVGYKWYYSTGSLADSAVISEVWEVTGIRTFNGLNYYQIDIHDLSLNTTTSCYYRYSGDTLFYKLPGYPEYIAADFSLRLNDTAYWDNQITVTQKTQEVITFSVPLTGDYSYSATYIKGVGLTEMTENGFVYYHRKLVKAEK
jgi:hypothetical protein